MPPTIAEVDKRLQIHEAGSKACGAMCRLNNAKLFGNGSEGLLKIVDHHDEKINNLEGLASRVERLFWGVLGMTGTLCIGIVLILVEWIMRSH